jgi:hypothetical protein
LRTNREFLNSLSNEAFADWIFNRLEIVDESGRYPITRMDGLHYVTLSYIDPYLGFKRWLEEEHREKKRKGGQ